MSNSMDEITINGEKYFKEGSKKSDIDTDSVREYLLELPSWKFVNIVQDVTEKKLKTKYFDINDLSSLESMSTEKVLTLFLLSREIGL
jgi:hypothetical protein